LRIILISSDLPKNIFADLRLPSFESSFVCSEAFDYGTVF